MGRVRERASSLRSLADELQGRARTLQTQADGVSWESSAADVFRTQLRLIVVDLGLQAGVLDDAAAALERHARAVDEVNRIIGEAQAWVSSRWDEAMHVARTVREVVHEVAEVAVTAFMTVLGDIIKPDATRALRVSVFTVGGVEVHPAQVQRAREIAAAVPAIPVHGSKDWIDLRGTFQSRGWA